MRCDKAALNMLTFTVAEDFGSDGISVLSIDTGWVSQMTPAAGRHKAHITSQPPLSCEDGAARILDPLLQWAKGTHPPSGKLLRHFKPAKW
jgi:NAD(P)-dependent dehydrogenase (short-subunit alcohol dehydrogenase family)